jgi:hypothetical protein
MPDEPIPPNTLSASGKTAKSVEGDVPEAIRRRYYLDDRGGAGLGFYEDAQVKVPAFRDNGRVLAAARSSPQTIRDMTAIARHRGWTVVMARGAKEFRREAWLTGRAVGLEVRGYRPSERDVQELDRRIDRRNLVASPREQSSSAGIEPAKARDPLDDPGARSRLRVVEEVVRSRVSNPEAGDRILTAARERLAGWLERGARIEPVRLVEPETAVERPASRERQR